MSSTDITNTHGSIAKETCKLAHGQIIHGPITLGGMALPDLYAYQGIDKVQFFLGHIRLGDTVGDLIAITLSQTQLLAGVEEFILNKASSLSTWLDSGWIMSVWTFLNDANLEVEYMKKWTPTCSRVGDMFLMDYFLSCNLKTNVLRILNRCRLYLQVLTLSDITSADGTYILPAVKNGEKNLIALQIY
jgi:hypothetical protein